MRQKFVYPESVCLLGTLRPIRTRDTYNTALSKVAPAGGWGSPTLVRVVRENARPVIPDRGRVPSRISPTSHAHYAGVAYVIYTHVIGA